MRRRDEPDWSGFRAGMRREFPTISDADLGLCIEALGPLLGDDGRSVDAILAEHLATPGPHGEPCGACGFLQAALYRQQTGRSLITDFHKMQPGPKGTH